MMFNSTQMTQIEQMGTDKNYIICVYQLDQRFQSAFYYVLRSNSINVNQL